VVGYAVAQFVDVVKFLEYLTIAESDIFANLADSFGRYVEERGDVLQVEVLHDARATLHEQVVTLAGCGAVEVEIAEVLSCSLF